MTKLLSVYLYYSQFFSRHIEVVSKFANTAASAASMFMQQQIKSMLQAGKALSKAKDPSAPPLPKTQGHVLPIWKLKW